MLVDCFILTLQLVRIFMQMELLSLLLQRWCLICVLKLGKGERFFFNCRVVVELDGLINGFGCCDVLAFLGFFLSKLVVGFQTVF